MDLNFELVLYITLGYAFHNLVCKLKIFRGGVGGLEGNQKTPLWFHFFVFQNVATYLKRYEFGANLVLPSIELTEDHLYFC